MTYSIIQKSQLEGAKRMDAEYYQQEFLEVEEKLNSVKTVTVEEISESVVNFGAYSLCNYIKWQDKGVPYLNVENVKDGYIDFDNVKFIDEKVNEILKKSEVKDGQVIITMAGTIGNVAVAHNISEKINSNQATAKITLKENFSPYYLAAFLNSYYGKNQTEREIVSSVQPNIFLFQIKNFKVPIASEVKQKEIEKVYKQGLDELENSKSLYSQAENLLLEELGLKDFRKKENLSYVVWFLETKKAHRIDAEYFDPVYAKVEKILNKFKQKRLGDISSLISYGTVPTSPYTEDGVPYVKGMNLQNCFIDYAKLDYLDKESTKKLPAKVYLKENDIIISQMGTVGRAALAAKSEAGWLFASFTIRVRLSADALKFLDPLYITLFINNVSRPYYLLRRIAQASVRQNTDLPTIKDLQIPILPQSVQQKIADLVRGAYQARKKAKELLEEAKRMVEAMIEDKY